MRIKRCAIDKFNDERIFGMEDQNVYRNEADSILAMFGNDMRCKVRHIEVNGEPWFYATDVCHVLGINSVTSAVKRLDDDEHALFSFSFEHAETTMNVVNESGLYSLILESRKPEAKKYQRIMLRRIVDSGVASLDDIIAHLS